MSCSRYVSFHSWLFRDFRLWIYVRFRLYGVLPILRSVSTPNPTTLSSLLVFQSQSSKAAVNITESNGIPSSRSQLLAVVVAFDMVKVEKQNNRTTC